MNRKTSLMLVAAIAILISPMGARAQQWGGENRVPGNPHWPVVCDRDGGNCRHVKPHQHQQREYDRDDENGDQYSRPAPYDGYSDNYSQLERSRGQTQYALDSARAQYYAALQRGDRRAAKHLLNAVHGRQRDLQRIDASIAAQGGVNYNSDQPGVYPDQYGYAQPPETATSPAGSLLGPLLNNFLNR